MDTDRIAEGVRFILEGLGEDLERPGLQGTPERVGRMYAEVLGGPGSDPREIVQVLSGERHDEIVLVRDIPFYSMCEHHLLPFHGKAHVAYLPKGGRITGLSKIARLVGVLSRRLQLQERLTTEIADVLVERLNPRGVMVVLEAEHLCMTMRGVRVPGAVTTTSVVRGLFRENAATRSEAMDLIYR